MISPSIPAPRRLALACVLTLAWDAAPCLASAPATPTFVARWGSVGTLPGQFTTTWGLAVNDAGEVYVVDRALHRVTKFDRNGNYHTLWGGLGTAPSQFDTPAGVAVGPTGQVYVADSNNGRIGWFDSMGNLISTFGVFGSGNGQFNKPYGLVTDAAGNVYVADGLNHRIQKFTASGTYLAQWGSFGTGNGQFNVPIALASGPGGIYAIDYNNSRIEQFSTSGAFIARWGSAGTGDGQFANPYDIATDPVGNVYVLDAGNDRVQKFTGSGTFLAQWGTAGSGDGQMIAPSGLDVDAEGNVYVADTGNRRVQKFSGSGYTRSDSYPVAVVAAAGAGAGAGQFAGPSGVATDVYGNFLVTDYANNRIQKFSSDGTFLAQFGSTGSGPAQLNGPVGIAVPPGDTDVYVVDSGNNRVQRFIEFTPNFYLQSGEVGGLGGGPGQFNSPHGVAVSAYGYVYVTDFYNHRVQIFSAGGLIYLGQFGGLGTGPGQFIGPAGVTVGRAGNVFVTDFANDQVKKFDYLGTPLGQWGGTGGFGALLSGPMGVVADPRGDVWVSDFYNDRIVKFDDHGGYVFEVPAGAPRDPAIDGAGNLYVPEYSANRVLKYVFPASIAMVSDVRNDQGQQARLRVLASSADAPGSSVPITRYDVFRKIDPLAAAVTARPGGALPAAAELAGWEQVGTFSAYGESEYNVVVPTLVNSTPDALQYSAYMVRAATATPYTFFDSATGRGMSVDNLSPPPPSPFTAALVSGSTHLHWGASPARDFAAFRLHRGADAGFVPADGNLLVSTADTGCVDAGPAGAWYKLAAVDVNGNSSVFVTLGPAQTLDAAGSPARLEFALEPVTPNPVQARDLEVAFTLASPGTARLELLDLAGRRVLECEAVGVGRHVVGLGRTARLRPGVYLVRLSQGGASLVRRAVVMG